MGSATVLMASGEKLPDDVKCIISDCGFTSVLDELAHNLKQSHIPPAIILPTATLLSKKRIGYSFKEASTIEQVKKSKTPTLFIHGDQDDFVPTYMVYDLYNACAADKDLLIVEGAKHAQSYYGTNPGMGMGVTEHIPTVEGMNDVEKASFMKSMEYMLSLIHISEAFNETVEELTQSLMPLFAENGMDWMYANCSTTAHIFPQVSFKPTVRLNTIFSGVESRSTLK